MTQTNRILRSKCLGKTSSLDERSEIILRERALFSLFMLDDHSFSFLFIVTWDLGAMMVIVKAQAFVWGCGLASVCLFVCLFQKGK